MTHLNGLNEATTPSGPAQWLRSRWIMVLAICGVVVVVVGVIVAVASGSDAENLGDSESKSSGLFTEEIDVPELPYTEVEAWTSLRVKMEGELPEGTIYRSIDANPSWVKVNRFTGEVHFAPKRGGIQLRPYDIVIGATLPDGQTVNIQSTVEVIENWHTRNPHHIGPRPDDGGDVEVEIIDPPVLPRTVVKAGDSVRVPLEGPKMPSGTKYIDNVGPTYMSVDRDTGEVHFNLDETFAGYPLGIMDILITGSLPGGKTVAIYSEVEVVAG